MLETFYDLYDEEAQRSLTRLSEMTGKPVGSIIVNRTPTLARYLAEATMPIAGVDSSPDGFSTKARDLGQGAVERDIRKVYVGSNRIYKELKNWADAKTGNNLARGFYKFIKNKDYAGAQSILQRAGVRSKNLQFQPWDSGAQHQRARNRRGRVGRSYAPTIIDDPKAVDDYIKTVKKRVGFAKSGWTNAAKQIRAGGGAVSAWIRNNSGPGVGQNLSQDPNNPRVLLTNQVNYITDILTEKYRLRAVGAFERSLGQEIHRVLEYLARKEAARANRGTTPGGK